MSYTITTTTTDDRKYVYTADSLDGVDAFLSRIQYRDSSQLVPLSDSPLTLTYAGNVRTVVIDGVDKADIEAHNQKKAEELQAAYQGQLAAKQADATRAGVLGGNSIGYGSALSANAVAPDVSTLSRLVP